MPDQLRKKIERSVQDLRNKAFCSYGVDINPNVTFCVKGLTAAYAVFDTQVLDFNLQLGLNNRELYETDIVGHEFVHLLADVVHGHQVHGKPWKEMMKEFGFQPDVDYQLNTSGLVQRKEKVYIYRCLCKTHYVTREKHLNSRRHVLQCPNCLGTAKCINDRASEMGRLQPGTRAWEISQLLAEYAALEVPPQHAILLLRDRLNVTYKTAKTYFYKYRPII